MNHPIFLPGATLGVMGGGQLGRMFVQAAQAMGYVTVVLDPDDNSPAGLISHHHIPTDYADAKGLSQLMQRCAAITTEFENVPAHALATLSATHSIAPSAQSVAVAQDRIKEKEHLKRSGVPTSPYAVIEIADHLSDVPDNLLPGILKTARLGYDGKGQVRVTTRVELASAWDALNRVPCVLEKMLPLALECSVIVARGHNGECVHYWPQRNKHRDGILAITQVYYENVPASLAHQAIEATKRIAKELNYVGVLCVEYFVLQEGSPEYAALGALVVNEMAPRPHNSGHYTIDACDVSQFELQVRTLAGLPLVQPRQHSAAVMLNLLGNVWLNASSDAATPSTPHWEKVLALPGVHLHLYGKLQARKGRKMGHLTVTAPTASQANATALEAARCLGMDAF